MRLYPKSNYEKFFCSCFDIGEVPNGPGKRNWNWLYFPAINFTFEQGATWLRNKLEVSLHFCCVWPTVWRRRRGAAVACATSSAYSVALTSFLIRPRLALSTIAAHFPQWSKYKPLCWQLYNRMYLTIICMDGLCYWWVSCPLVLLCVQSKD